MKGKKDSSGVDFTDLETMIQGQVVNMEFLLLQELRDIDHSVGTPLYQDKVKTLQRTIESNHKIIEDKQYWVDMEKAFNLIDDKNARIHNMREPGINEIEIPKIKQIDWELKDSIIRKYLAKHNLTFKKERHITL